MPIKTNIFAKNEYLNEMFNYYEPDYDGRMQGETVMYPTSNSPELNLP